MGATQNRRAGRLPDGNVRAEVRWDLGFFVKFRWVDEEFHQQILEQPAAAAPEVVRGIELALKVDDKSRAASYASHLGTGFSLTGDRAESLKWFRRAAELNPKDENHRLRLSDSLYENGDHQQAIDVMVQAGEFPKDLYTQLRLLTLLDQVVYQSPEVTQQLKARLKQALKQSMLDRLGFVVPEPETGEAPAAYEARVQELVDKHLGR